MRRAPAGREGRPSYPTTIRVGPLDYTVKRWNPLAAENTKALGLCDRSTCVILLKDGMSPQKEAEVLIHEVVHAAYDGSGLNTDQARPEEEIVNVLGYMLLGILRDNPALSEYVNEVFAQ